MASSLLLKCSSRILSSTSRTVVSRCVSTTSVSRADKKLYDPEDPNDPIAHATGLEKYELLARKAGNDDPFFMGAVKRGKGTKDEPNIVNAMASYRMVGCVCNEDSDHIRYMWLFENKPKRCACGHWFKIKRHEAPVKYQLPI